MVKKNVRQLTQLVVAASCRDPTAHGRHTSFIGRVFPSSWIAAGNGSEFDVITAYMGPTHESSTS